MYRTLVILWLLLAALFSPLALGQTAVLCPATSPLAKYCEQQPCSGGTCTRSTTPSAIEFTTPVAGYPSGKGLPLSGSKGAFLMLCAASGQTLTGTGTVRIWNWGPWAPNDVSSSALMELDVADVWIDNACSGSDCPCVHWPDWQVAGASSRRVIAQAVGVGVSGGTSIEFRWFGLGVQ